MLYPVDIYPPLKDKITAPIVQLQQQVVDTAGQGRLTMSKGREKKLVSTCIQYKKRLAEHYTIASNYDLSIGSFFMLWCTSLDKLALAKPSKFSYVNNFKLSKSYGQLPVSSIFSLVKSPNMTPLMNQFSDVVVDHKSAYSVVIHSEKAHQKAVINLLARADFNDDGVEDMLISVADYAIDGSYHHYGVFVLSRFHANAPIIFPATPTKS